MISSMKLRGAASALGSRSLSGVLDMVASHIAPGLPGVRSTPGKPGAICPGSRLRPPQRPVDPRQAARAPEDGQRLVRPEADLLAGHGHAQRLAERPVLDALRL